MPFRTGDIDELYEWSDDDRSDYSERPEEKRVGTHASFEELLERELAKDHEQNDHQGGGIPAKPRRQFLKKGARGWWMENATAKQKMQKHVLESVVLDNGDNNNQLGHNRKASVKANVSPPTKGRRPSPPASSAGTVSPEPARREDVAPVQISPMRLTPTPRASMEGPRRSLPIWASAHANRRTDESIETLNMSRVRQDFENRREREADELADFEALEQELAAEKESYLREKHQIEEDQTGITSKACYDDEDEASWLRDSADGASLRGEAQHLLSGAAAFRSSYSDLDLGGDSAMVFDDDRVFRSPMPRAPSVRDSSQRPRHSRPSFAPSEISAVSLNDSEPWGDANALDHFSNVPESPIPKHGMASALLHGVSTQGYGSNRRDSLSSRRGANRRFEDQDLIEESPSYYEDLHEVDEVDSTERGHSTSRHGTSLHDAPVSALVQQIFGGATQPEEVWDADRYQPSRQHSRTDNGRGVGGGSNKKPNALSPRLPRAGQGRKLSRQSIARDEREGGEQLEQPSPKHAPGVLPVSIEEKLAKLEEETKLYKSETLQLQRKKALYDEEIQRLVRDKEDMSQYQDKQRQLMEQEWQQHRRKMKQEERNFERQMKLKLSAAGSRKDRAQIDALNAKIAVLKSEAEQSSAKMKATNDVLRQRIAELEGRNRELSEEVKFLERDRLDQWQKYEDLLKEVNTRKVKKPEDGCDQLKTLDDISRVSRSAEDLLSSLQFSKAEASQSRTPTSSTSAASTPMNANGGEYNPGRYRQADAGRVKPANSSQSSSKHSQEDDANNGRFGCVIDETGVNEVVHPGGKREITYRDGTKRIFFADGNEKEILPNGDVVIRFTNGDRKEYFPSTGVSVYHYHEAQTKLTTYPDKTKVYEFPNKQIEKSYPDGTTEIQFADGILKTIHPSGDEFSKFPDGTTMLETKAGLREVTLLSGKKVRYYPDGNMTLVNLDGQESEVRSDEELRELMETI